MDSIVLKQKLRGIFTKCFHNDLIEERNSIKEPDYLSLTIEADSDMHEILGDGF